MGEKEREREGGGEDVIVCVFTIGVGDKRAHRAPSLIYINKGPKRKTGGEQKKKRKGVVVVARAVGVSFAPVLRDLVQLFD